MRAPVNVEVYSGVIGPGAFRGGHLANFTDAHLDGVDFRGHRFRYLGTDGSTFRHCDFSRVAITSGYLDPRRSSIFADCTFDGIRPGALIWGSTRFERCSFTSLRMKDWRLDAAEFVDCTFTGHISGVSFWASPRKPYDTPDRLVPFRQANELRGNDFSKVHLQFPDFFGGVEISANRWPSGQEYAYYDRWQERIGAAGDRIGVWPSEERKTATWWLDLHSRDGREAQREIVIRKRDWSMIEPVAVWPRLWRLLGDPDGDTPAASGA